MAVDLTVSLSERAARALRELAYRQRRRPEAQVEVLVEAGLGLRPGELLTGNPTLRLVDPDQGEEGNMEL